MSHDESSNVTNPPFCADCGERLHEGAEFCSGCGSSVHGTELHPPELTKPSDDRVSIQFRGTSIQDLLTGGLMLIVIGVVALLVVGVFGVVSWLAFSLATAAGSPFVLFFLLLVGWVGVLPPLFAWFAVLFNEWLVGYLSFSDGTEASFEGRVGEIWGLYALYMFTVWILFILSINGLPQLISAPIVFLIAMWIGFKLFVWFVNQLALNGSRSLFFRGNFLLWLGWIVLLNFSIFTIVGWAWVSTAMARWLFGNIHSGTNQLVFVGTGTDQFVFVGAGISLLWRGLVGLAVTVVTLGVALPWVYIWIFRWYASNTFIQRDTTETA